MDYADGLGSLRRPLTRKTVRGMRVNYDLLRGRLHMDDLKALLNPYGLDASFFPESIPHYPVLNSKLQVLKGEESRRVFDFRVVVTNPGAISEMEEGKKRELAEALRGLLAGGAATQEEFDRRLERMDEYFAYEWQDMREARANQLLNHYMKELEIPHAFNDGFLDAMTVGEEIYQCDIVGGEPVVERLDPLKVRVLMSGNSDRVEDADAIVVEDWWSPGRVVDTFYDRLSKKDMEYLENGGWHGGRSDSMDDIDPRTGFVYRADSIGDTAGESLFDPLTLFGGGEELRGQPWDAEGNVRVLKVYWKSRRKIKKVKGYDPETGEETFSFYPEDYTARAELGEEEQSFWVNEAWEGVKIGSDIYVDMGPRPVQYNRMGNPSCCHFGIIGSIYGTGGGSPFSMVDMMKPYNYLYDVVHDRLNKLLAKNWGKMVRLDLGKVPDKWGIDKWLYYATVNGLAVEDSFNEGKRGAATGKLAGAMNNASSGVIDAGLGGEIQFYFSLLETIDQHMGNVAGISPQRVGEISNRETVGGVERATLQSSHITEWLFLTHESVKRRVLECLLETAKIALRGRGKKFAYILSDGSERLADIDGDEFAECDYGLVVDNSNGVQELNQKLDTLAQAALQNQLLDFSSVMKLYTTTSLAEKQRMVETAERRAREREQQQQQQQLQMQQQQLEQDARQAEAQLEQQYKMHREDNETKVLVAEINSKAEDERFAMMQGGEDITAEQQYRLRQEELRQKIKESDAKMRREDERLGFEREKHREELSLKRRQLAAKGE